MKKIFAILSALAVATVILAGCGNSSSSTEASSSATDDTSTSTAASGDYGKGWEFKHGFDRDYPPYSYIGDDGQTTGFDVELAKAVCDYYGWTYTPVSLNWDAKDAELNANSCDCIWSGFTKNGREDDYQWSKPYSNNTQMILVKTDSGIKKLSDLAGKKVGVQTSTSAYDMLAEGEQSELAKTFDGGAPQVFDTYTTAFEELKAGSIDAIAIDVTAGNHLIDGESDYKYLDEELGTEQYAIGFRKGETELCNKVDEAIDALVADGTFDKIGQKYPEIYEYLSRK